jgi:hypothetical protein
VLHPGIRGRPVAAALTPHQSVQMDPICAPERMSAEGPRVAPNESLFVSRISIGLFRGV